MSEQELVTKEEVAELLRVDVRTVEKLMQEGVLPYYKIGKANKRAKLDRRPVRFVRADILKRLDSDFLVNGKGLKTP